MPFDKIRVKIVQSFRDALDIYRDVTIQMRLAITLDFVIEKLEIAMCSALF